MGFVDQAQTEQFTRTSVTINKNGGVVIASGSVISPSNQVLGSSFLLLSATATQATRVRLYSDSASLVTDATRTSTDYNINDSVGLIADVTFTSEQLKVNLNPPIIGTTYDNGVLWYNLSSSLPESSVTLQAYPIGQIGNSLIGRQVLVISQSSVPTTGYGVSGSITTPNSFLIFSGSASKKSRLRLYSTTTSEVPLAEQTRSFGTASISNTKLIADLMFDTANFQYKLVPILEAYTWQGAGYNIGTGTTGYILENKDSSTSDVTASLYVYSLED